jgi:casein kinase II subunit alpha
MGYDFKLLSKGNIDDYEVIRKIGRGKYSEVFDGINSNNSKKVFYQKF